MKNTLFILLVYLVGIQVKAQNYTIDFAISGENVVPDSVRVTNLNTNLSLLLNENDTLQLNVSTLSGNDYNLSENNSLKIYPNPIDKTAIVEYNSPTKEKAKIKLFDILGRLVINRTMELNVGLNNFSLKGLKAGTYILNIYSSVKKESTTIISKSNGESSPKFDLINTSKTIP